MSAAQKSPWQWMQERTDHSSDTAGYTTFTARDRIEAGQPVYSSQLMPYMAPVLAAIEAGEPAPVYRTRTMTLTAAEEKTLNEIKDGIMRRWRRRMVPVFRYADGTVMRRPQRRIQMPSMDVRWITPEEERLQMVRRARALVDQMRGVPIMQRMAAAFQEMTVRVGGADGSIRVLGEVVETRRFRGPMVVYVDTANARRVGCGCPNCDRMGPLFDENSTRPQPNRPFVMPMAPAEMPMALQSQGPLCHPFRLRAPLSGYGHFLAGEPGAENLTRREPAALEHAIKQADRNREMQYDERTWEI